LIVLDTSVLSELMRPDAEGQVLAWVDAQPVVDLTITSVTAAELRVGVALLPAGRRRSRIAAQVDALIDETFARAVLPFDTESAPHYAEIVARRTRAGTPITALDAQIAAVCRQYDATLATRNQRDFVDTGVPLIDPWTAV
jgi:hypothetical protein